MHYSLLKIHKHEDLCKSQNVKRKYKNDSWIPKMNGVYSKLRPILHLSPPNSSWELLLKTTHHGCNRRVRWMPRSKEFILWGVWLGPAETNKANHHMLYVKLIFLQTWYIGCGPLSCPGWSQSIWMVVSFTGCNRGGDSPVGAKGKMRDWMSPQCN